MQKNWNDYSAALDADLNSCLAKNGACIDDISAAVRKADRSVADLNKHSQQMVDSSVKVRRLGRLGGGLRGFANLAI